MTAVTLPYDFVGGTRAIADQVDANFNALLNALNANVATVLTTNTTFYVGPGGSDTPNSGLTPATPCATITYLYGLLLANYIFGAPSVVVTIQLAPGTYNETVVLSGLLRGQYSHQSLVINGNTSNPGGTTIAGNPCLSADHMAMATLQGVTLTSPSLHCLYANNSGFLAVNTVVFGSAAANQIEVQAGGIIRTAGNYSITGNAQCHWRCQGSGAQIWIVTGALGAPTVPGPTITIVGTPAFSNAFAVVGACANVLTDNVTFVNPGSATGKQYTITNNGTFTTDVAGALVLPGNVPGTTDHGGVYN